MQVKKEQWPVLIVMIGMLVGFGLLFVSRKNYEFIMYVGVIVFFVVLIGATNARVNYPNGLLWGLAGWALLHLAGGGVTIGDGRLYDVMLIPLSATYPILRYDQVVHIFGFGVATLLMYRLLEPLLKPRPERWTALSIVIVMAGLGVGALNEIVEFGATVLAPETGVGGYLNTSLDLVADLVGALIAVVFIRIRS
jgi:uncharacterized membrane protein YjdF